MPKPRLFLCNGAKLPNDSNRLVKKLKTYGDDANVNIELEDVAKIFSEKIDPRLVDLLEIASFIFTADTSTKRGQYWTDKDPTEAWSRDFKFIIPVRDYEFWKTNETKELLTKCLGFLSDDSFEFNFIPFNGEQSGVHKQLYLKFSDLTDWPFYDIKRVVMFSGGLDSLSGTLDYLSKNENTVLVSHRPTPVISKRQEKLFKKLKDIYGKRILHVPVWINKSSKHSREHTQRTRSFLLWVQL